MAIAAVRNANAAQPAVSALQCTLSKELAIVGPNVNVKQALALVDPVVSVSRRKAWLPNVLA